MAHISTPSASGALRVVGYSESLGYMIAIDREGRTAAYVYFTADEIEQILDEIAEWDAQHKDIAAPIPDYPDDIPSLAEQESQQI